MWGDGGGGEDQVIGPISAIQADRLVSARSGRLDHATCEHGPLLVYQRFRRNRLLRTRPSLGFCVKASLEIKISEVRFWCNGNVDLAKL
ncbi:hypothetical protein D3C78_428900 [compost metagenome]